MGWAELKLPWPLAPIGFPITEWLPQYNSSLLMSDIVAGMTVFVFLIPQGMAYSLLAGLPPVYGLYSSTVPLYIYTIFGTSRQLSLGPMAITSLLLGVSVQNLGYEEESDEYIVAALNVSLVVGIVIFLLGIFQLGTLANFISQSVLTGFLTASALVIVLNQMKYIFGIEVPRKDYTVETIGHLLSHLPDTNPNALAFSCSFGTVLYLIKRWRQQNKATPENMAKTWFRFAHTGAKLSNFVAIVVSSFVAQAIRKGGADIDIVGTVPSGLKTPGFTFMSISEIFGLVPSSLAIAFVAFAGNWAVAKKYSMQHKYEVNATQELIAAGLSNITGVFFNSFATSGGLARSAVNAESGAMTQISAVIVASLMLIAVQFLTELFYFIPMSVLGTIIVVSVISMMDFDAMSAAYGTHRKDFIVMVVTCFATFLVGVSEGLFIGIIISLCMILHTTAFPTVVHLGKLPEDEGGHYRDLARYAHAEQFPGVAVIRMDATLFFANAAHFKDMVKRAADGEFHSCRDTPIHKVVIDASCWIDLDLGGVKALFELKEDLVVGRGIVVAIACAKGQVRDRLRNSQFRNEVGSHYMNMTVTEAMTSDFCGSEKGSIGNGVGGHGVANSGMGSLAYTSLQKVEQGDHHSHSSSDGDGEKEGETAMVTAVPCTVTTSSRDNRSNSLPELELAGLVPRRGSWSSATGGVGSVSSLDDANLGEGKSSISVDDAYREHELPIYL